MSWDTVENPHVETYSDLFTGGAFERWVLSENIEPLSSEAGVTPRRYLAKESMLVISGNSWESDLEFKDAKGVGMCWASPPNPDLPYEDAKMGVFLA